LTEINQPNIFNTITASNGTKIIMCGTMQHHFTHFTPRVKANLWLDECFDHSFDYFFFVLTSRKKKQKKKHLEIRNNVRRRLPMKNWKNLIFFINNINNKGTLIFNDCIYSRTQYVYIYASVCLCVDASVHVHVFVYVYAFVAVYMHVSVCFSVCICRQKQFNSKKKN
jgi:hypothetical protein